MDPVARYFLLDTSGFFRDVSAWCGQGRTEPVQTFLPYADFAASAAVLDDRRLGKQRVETLQVLRALVYPSYKGWKNHPVTKMWRGFTAALVAYGVTVCEEWKRRGRPDAVRASLLEFTGGTVPDVTHLARAGRLPPWLGLEALHLSHRSSLVRKDPEHYRPFFPDVPDDLPYIWPPAAFPRWPVRNGYARDVNEAAAELGWDEPRPGQAAAVAALLSGRDVLLDWPPRTGATGAALLAALCLPGSTLWISPHAGSTDFTAPPLADLQPAPLAQRPGKLSASIARPPTAEDLAELAREAAEPPAFAFHLPAALRREPVAAAVREAPPSLLVLDGASAADARRVLAALPNRPVAIGIGKRVARALPGAVRPTPDG